ncbi:MAG: phenylalanine--tRNA ligase subunit beta [Methylotenera sp.]|nr:phenylalanine--tRNA ligase subunit beta [Oligoflexia bacterium]
MQVSWNWLSELVDLSSVAGPQALADLLTQRGLEVEEMKTQGVGLEKVVSAQILEKKQHPQADRLSLCSVSLGSGEPLDIVCGAQNMKAGDKVALAQVGANLPNGMKIAQGKIRGEVSNGMLCSESELGFAAQSEGIIILPPDTELGLPLAKIMGLNDTIFTLKLTANRGDCLSHYGLAREIASALRVKAKKPIAELVQFKGSPIEVSLNAGEGAPQFFGCYLEGVKVGPSPRWLVSKLEAVGSRSINNIVDATNFVMLELGHPTHAYDADRIEGKKIGVRIAQEGEKLPLLDKTEITLVGTELVIEDGSRAIGLAGVMGGGNSEVQDSTTRVFLECAEFAPGLVRRGKTRHQKQTDAAHRFERGIDPQNLPFVISRLAHLVVELAGGKIVGGASAQTRAAPAPRPIEVHASYFNSFLGTSLETAEIENVLLSLECQVEKSQPGKSLAEKAAESGAAAETLLLISPPSYRLDLNIREDLAEEVARSVGYDKIPSTVPQLTTAPTASATEPAVSRLILVDRAKDALVQLGLAESLNYSFTSAQWLAQFGMKSSLKVVNPLSVEHEHMVPSLLPGLVHNALDNWRHSFGSESLAIRLFELRPTFQFKPAASSDGAVAGTDGAVAVPAATGETETGVEEKWKLSFVMSGPRSSQALRAEQSEMDFYDLKAVVENLFANLGTKGIRFMPASASRTPENEILKLLHPGQSVEILAGNAVAGYFGMLHPGKARELKARAPLWIAELDWEVVSKMSRGATESRGFKPWAEFPPMERDFAMVVKNDVAADKITQVVLKAGKPLAKTAKIFDVYRGSQVPEGMTSVAVRVIFLDEGRSLQEVETDAASSQIISALQKELGAQLRT